MKKDILLIILILGLVFAAIPVKAAVTEGCKNVPLGSIKYDPNRGPGKAKLYQDPAYYLNIALNVIKYAGVILCIGLSMADLFKNLMSEEKDGHKKIIMKVVKRLIYATLIFFLPIMINKILELTGLITNQTCGIE